jgi:hypothetical protein
VSLSPGVSAFDTHSMLRARVRHDYAEGASLPERVPSIFVERTTEEQAHETETGQKIEAKASAYGRAFEEAWR